MTQPVEAHVTVSTNLPVPGPTLDDQVTAIDVVNAPACFTTAGVSFYGTLYTTIYVESNGRIMMQNASADPTPSALEFMNGPPAVGVWANFTVGGGSISISSPSLDVVRVDYSNVAYSAIGGLSSFAIIFDTANLTVQLDGLMGVNPATGGLDMLMGITPGLSGGATDPGTTLFTLGGAGVVTLVTDMLQDNAVGGVPGSLGLGTLNNVTFLDDSLGNYVWTGN